MDWRQRWKASWKTTEQFREENQRHFGFLEHQFGFASREMNPPLENDGVHTATHYIIYEKGKLSISVSFDIQDRCPYVRIRQSPDGKWKNAFSLENEDEKKSNPYVVCDSRDREFIEAIYHHYAVILRRFLSEKCI